MKATQLIAVTGGIGAGKSVVCKLLRSMGFDVYDCDYNAKSLMDRNAKIKEELATKISPNTISPEGHINRRILSDIVFNDSCKLEILNKIVHGAVIEDIRKWKELIAAPIAFIETAILYQSGLDKEVEAVWDVSASSMIRIRRVMQRNNLSELEVQKRIEAQTFVPDSFHHNITNLINDDKHSLIAQVNKALERINAKQ